MLTLPNPESVAREAELDLSHVVRGEQEVLEVIKAVYAAINRCTTQPVRIEEAPK